MQIYLENYFGKEQIIKIDPLAKAGSDRQYYRVHLQDQTYIACESKNLEENETFFYFTSFFSSHQIPVPALIDIHVDRSKYILQDLGTSSLLDLIQLEGHTESVKQIYKHALSNLVAMQIAGGEKLDFSQCYAASAFDKNAVLADLNYFKYYFLDLNKINYNKALLNDEFEKLAARIGSIEPQLFMFRDFQGRNIMIKEGQPFFIDYQGGMKGPLQYDIASLLWQAKAQLPTSGKQELYTHYKNELKNKISFNETLFDSNYSLLVLIRLLQVLGAYGLRGMIEKRHHFLSSIPLGLENVFEWRSTYSLNEFPILEKILVEMESGNLKSKFQEPVSSSPNLESIPKLKILVQSFSFKKGLPDDESGNGGGYVFDCRGILNPGRFDEYKKLTGRDQPVIDFLESETKMGDFLKHTQNIVDISVNDYISRGFENLQISFGCTGGQHRSVYCADAMAKYLKQKYKVEVEVRHVVQDAKNWVN
ncbi:MAG TPA: RNase adapter RapZ [Chitinophagaceae bacterium]|nr:RNase adapter RapZ [Chitinophagaceae bacterium]